MLEESINNFIRDGTYRYIDGDLEFRWNKKCENLKQYCLENDLPKHSNKEFGNWIDTQRQKYKKNNCKRKM